MSNNIIVLGYTWIENEKFNEMKNIYHSCRKVGIPVPEEVIDFFDERGPPKEIVTTPLDKAVEYFSDGSCRITLEELPDDVFYLCCKAGEQPISIEEDHF